MPVSRLEDRKGEREKNGEKRKKKNLLFWAKAYRRSVTKQNTCIHTYIHICSEVDKFKNKYKRYRETRLSLPLYVPRAYKFTSRMTVLR